VNETRIIYLAYLVRSAATGPCGIGQRL